MRLLLSLCFFLFSLTSYSQKTDLATVRNFWDTTIMEIVRLDKDKIIEHTHFPVEGSWGYALEMEGLSEEPEEWSDADFKNNLDKIYTAETRSALQKKTYNDLVHFIDDQGELNFILQLTFETEMDGETYESATILYFKRYESIWKLFKIEYAG